MYPQLKLHQLYSLNLYEGFDVIFEDLSMVDISHIEEVIKTKMYNKINIVPNIFTINTINKEIMLVGSNINSTTYMINKQGRGDILLIKYNCPLENIISGLEYLYNIYKTNKSLKPL